MHMLLTHTDLQPALNIDLTDPNGQELADTLIAATQSLFSGPRFLDFPIEQRSVTEYHDGGLTHYWLNTTAPVTELVASTRNSDTNAYDTIDAGQVLNHGGREVYLNVQTPAVFHGLRLTYQTGWTVDTLPDELRQAIIETVGLKLMEIANFSSAPPGAESGEEEGEGESSSTPAGTLKKVISLGYTEEFSTAEAEAYWKAKTAQLARTIGDDLPQSIKDTVLAYRPAFAL